MTTARRLTGLSRGGGGGGGGFVPTDLASLLAWWDFSDASTVFTDTGRTSSAGADDPIKGVTDLSGGGRHLSESSTPPTRKLAITNGRAVARFDGSDDWMQASSGSLAQPYTIAAVVRSTSGTDGSGNKTIFSGSSFLPFLGWEATDVYGYYADTNQTGGTMDGATHAIVAVFNGASSSIRVDGVAVVSANPGTGNLSGGTFYIGRAEGGGSPADMDLGEMVVTNTALSGTPLTDLETYFGRWGV